MTRLSRLSLFWRFQIVGWMTFGVATFPLKWVVIESIHSALAVSLYREGMGFLVTSGMHEIYRRFYRERMGMGILCFLVLIVSLIGAAIQAYLCVAFHDLFDLDEEKVFKNMVIFAILYFRGGLCLGWSFLYFTIKLWFEKRDREMRLEKEKTKRHEAELLMLRAQMNPHFLYNAFNTILAEIGDPQKSLWALVQSLAEYLRYSLENRDRQWVPLGEEIDAIDNYLAVEKARFRNELEIEVSVAKDARSVLVPGVIIQPLIENAIKYGNLTSPMPCRVRLLISQPHLNRASIAVSNTGRWVEPDRQRSVGGVGLENLKQRLALIYSDDSRLDISEADGWVIVRVDIPIGK